MSITYDASGMTGYTQLVLRQKGPRRQLRKGFSFRFPVIRDASCVMPTLDSADSIH